MWYSSQFHFGPEMIFRGGWKTSENARRPVQFATATHCSFLFSHYCRLSREAAVVCSPRELKTCSKYTTKGHKNVLQMPCVTLNLFVICGYSASTRPSGGSLLSGLQVCGTKKFLLHPPPLPGPVARLRAQVLPRPGEAPMIQIPL